MAERTRRELQRQVPRRVPEHGMVSEPPRSRADHRDLAAALQRGQAAFEPGLLDPDRVQDGERQDDNPADRGRLSIIEWPREPGQVSEAAETQAGHFFNSSNQHAPGHPRRSAVRTEENKRPFVRIFRRTMNTGRESARALAA